jgi:hypothetical protein
MLIGIEGNVGTGKTLFMVRCLVKDSGKGRSIYTNLLLNDIPSNNFDIDEFLSGDSQKDLFNATIGLDEITVYMDCRLGSSKQNLLMGYLVLQSRKRNIDIYYTTQNLDLVDYKRLVKYTNYIVYCEKTQKDNPNIRIYTFFDVYKNSFKTKIMDIRPYYSFYDTNQIIEPLVKWKNKEKKP